MPEQEVAAFADNIGYARHLLELGVALEAQVTSAMDVSDLYRSALVQAVSAFDHFIHEEVRARMVGLSTVSPEQWPTGYENFAVRMTALKASGKQSASVWLDEEVRLQHGHLSFQHPDRIAEAFKLVMDDAFWPRIAAHMDVPTGDAKKQLKLIVGRRNRIAHEADMDPTPPRARYPITPVLVQESIEFLESIVSAVTLL